MAVKAAARPGAGRRALPAILLLRPQPQAGQTAAELRALGFAPVIAPASRIEMLAAAALPPLPYTALLASSANAFTANGFITSGFAALPAQLRQLPLYCAGAKTAAAARAQGCDNIGHIAANAAELCRFLARRGSAAKAGGRPCFLYLAGRPRRPDIEHFLTRRNWPFFTAELYQTVPLPPKPDAALPAAFAAALLYSARDARALRAFAAHISAETAIFCLSERIKAALPPQLQLQARCPTVPAGAELLHMLAQRFKTEA